MRRRFGSDGVRGKVPCLIGACLSETIALGEKGGREFARRFLASASNSALIRDTKGDLFEGYVGCYYTIGNIPWNYFTYVTIFYLGKIAYNFKFKSLSP